MTEIDTALALPTGDAPLLTNLGKNLAYVASHGTDTELARTGASGLGLGGSWAGPAFQAAGAEAEAGARLSHEVSDRIGPVVSAVNQYAGQLTNARRTVEALREQWLAADRLLAETAAGPVASGADPAAALELTRAADAHRERTRTELLTRHAACLQSLEASEDQAAATVSAALGQAVSPGGQRLLMLSQLPLTQGAARRAEVAALVAQACAGLVPDATSWSRKDIERVLGALSGSVDDPMMARALMDRLGGPGLQHVAASLWESSGEPRPGQLPGEAEAADAALKSLAAGFVTSVSDAPYPDAGSAVLLDPWRQGWVNALLDQPLEGLTTQLALAATAAAGSPRLLPGYSYASGALRALLSRPMPVHPLDLQRQGTGGYLTPTSRPLPDPYASLLGVLKAGPELGRQVLMSSGAHGPTLLHDLVVHRPLAQSQASQPLQSSQALGELVLPLAGDLGHPSATQRELTTAFLDALGTAGQGWWPLQAHESVNVDRHLDPLRWPAAVLLSANPSRIWDAINVTAVLADGGAAAAHEQALIGEIAKDVITSSAGAPTTRSLNTLLASVTAFETHRLEQAMSSTPDPMTSEEVKLAWTRLGKDVGFTAQSAAEAMKHAGATLDTVNRSDQAFVRALADGIDLLPIPAAHPVGAAVSILKAPVLKLATNAFNGAHAVDNRETATAHERELRALATNLVLTSAGETVQVTLANDATTTQVVAEEAALFVLSGTNAVNPAGPVGIAAR